MPAAYAACAAVATALAWAPASRADELADDDGPPPPAIIVEKEGYTGPNRALVTVGLVAFGVAYVPSVIVGAESARSTDRRLFIPVVGPWLDLANRPDCRTGSIGCGRETANKLLLVASGTFQVAGALAVLAAFVFPERDGYLASAASDPPRQRRDAERVHVEPAELGGGGYGVLAFGFF
ncbi:MAG: hypothetical protein FWD17_13850 [Polyangiaceae bacterium]|nr:hypothetical protein [Polyangiaceae bacterium]